MLKTNLTVLIASLILSACGGTEEEYYNPPIPGPVWENKKPVVVVASPGTLAVGEKLTILGQDFVDKAHGRVVLRIKGTYFNSEGETNQVDFQAMPEMVNSGKVRWNLWPNIVFDRTGDHLGRFVGQVIILNQGNDGSQKFSDAFPFSLDINPSIIARAARPTTGGCSSVISDTLEGQPMMFIAEAVGLRPPSQDNPITFYWTFMAEQWNVTLSYNTLNPGSVAPKTGSMMLEDVVTSGTTSSLSDGGDRNFLLKVGSDLIGNTGLKELRTGTIEASGNNMPVTVNIAAVDASGKQAKTSIKIVIHRKADLLYEGVSIIAERYAPQMVSDCMPGGDIGRDVNYHEGSSESRARSMSFNWNVSAGGSVNPGAFLPGSWNNPWALGINFSVGFGVNVNEHASSDTSQSLSLNGHILPGEYGAFYRQTSKVYRIGQLMGYTVCGQAVKLGEAILTDWIWTPDLATGPSCPPPTKLQPAQTFRD